MDMFRESKHQCCCGGMHVRTGALIVAILTFIGGVASFVYAIVTFNESSAQFTLNICFATARITFACLIFYGLLFEKPKMLYPYLAYQLFQVFELMALFVIGVIGILNPDFIINHFGNWFEFDDHMLNKKQRKTIVQIAMIFMVIGCFFAVFIGLWFFRVVQKCYSYLKAQIMPSRVNV